MQKAFYDVRDVRNGDRIPAENYSDQPFLVKAKDGAWVLVVTTGNGHEGAGGQHIVSVRSTDCGKTWSQPLDVESPEVPESSYAVLYQTAYGRIYCFYNFNADDIREVYADDPPFPGGKCTRVDTQGHFVFRYSDDCGKSWSQDRYEIPIRRFQVDLDNPYGGKIMYFWNVGKAFSNRGEVFVPLYKVGNFGEGFMYNSECALLMSDNLETERNPDRLHWATLPEGDTGIRVDRTISKVSEEHSFVTLSDGSVFCVFRTTTGFPYCAYSRDNCRTFTRPCVMQYADGRPMRHPRAANFIWKCNNGKFLYWYHNHAGTWYDDRNPVFLSAGEEYEAEDGLRIRFSQPELLLYDEDVLIRMSYPDMIEDGGEYYFTETQKYYARTHKADKKMIERLFTQFDAQRKPLDGISLHHGSAMPHIPPFVVPDDIAFDHHGIDTGSSFAVAFTIDINQSGADVLFSTEDQEGRGICIYWCPYERQVGFQMSDGRRTFHWLTDPGVLDASGKHRVAVTVDGGSRVMMFFVDGILCDGAGQRQFGFGRFDKQLIHANGSNQVQASDRVSDLQYYPQFVSVTEAIIL